MYTDILAARSKSPARGGRLSLQPIDAPCHVVSFTPSEGYISRKFSAQELKLRLGCSWMRHHAVC